MHVLVTDVRASSRNHHANFSHHHRSARAAPMARCVFPSLADRSCLCRRLSTLTYAPNQTRHTVDCASLGTPCNSSRCLCRTTCSSSPALPGPGARSSRPLSIPRSMSKGFTHAATALQPSRKMARASTVAVVVPSPTWSIVLLATVLTSRAPKFTTGARPPLATFWSAEILWLISSRLSASNSRRDECRRSQTGPCAEASHSGTSMLLDLWLWLIAVAQIGCQVMWAFWVNKCWSRLVSLLRAFRQRRKGLSKRRDDKANVSRQMQKYNVCGEVDKSGMMLWHTSEVEGQSTAGGALQARVAERTLWTMFGRLGSVIKKKRGIR